MAPKRQLSVATGNGLGLAAHSEKRLRADGGIPHPAAPPSPGRRLLRQTVLVVLFLIRAKDRNMGNVRFSLAQIGRVVREQIRHCLDPIVRKLEIMEGRICALTQKVDKITSNSCKGYNQERHTQETNQEGTSAGAEGLAENGGKGKRTRIRLKFLNSMKSLIYHEDDIRSDSDSAIRIGIFDGNNMIKSGQLSTLKIEILALNGDFPYDASDIWTSKEFDQYRVGGRYGRGNVLAGSCNAPNKKFIVGARVCNCEQTDGRIQEAVMKPVIVQDRRNKFNEKSHPPKLLDKVHRLEVIANGGKYCNRLGKENIVTVQDFLKALNKDPDNLARILEIKKDHQAWKKMVKHAQDCCLEGNHKLKSYHSVEGNVVLFFDCVDRLVGVKFDEHYISSERFHPAQQDLVDKLKKQAYAWFDGLIDDHVMIDKCPVPIYMDADAGPSYESSATQKKISDDYATYQHCEGTAAAEGLNHAPQIELSCVNENDNDGPGTHNYQRIETGLVVQEESPSTSLNGWCRGLLRGPNYSVGASEEFCFCALDDGAPCLPDVEYTINYGLPVDSAIEQEPTSCVAPGFDRVEIQSQRQRFLLHSNQTMEPATAAHCNTTLTTRQLIRSGDPGVAEGSVRSQVETRLDNTGSYQASNSAHSSLPQAQWFQFQGNMPWNGSL